MMLRSFLFNVKTRGAFLFVKTQTKFKLLHDMMTVKVKKHRGTKAAVSF
jgi:hypothetical protein